MSDDIEFMHGHDEFLELNRRLDKLKQELKDKDMELKKQFQNLEQFQKTLELNQISGTLQNRNNEDQIASLESENMQLKCVIQQSKSEERKENTEIQIKLFDDSQEIQKQLSQHTQFLEQANSECKQLMDFQQQELVSVQEELEQVKKCLSQERRNLYESEENNNVSKSEYQKKLDTLSQEVQNLRARIELDRQVINQLTLDNLNYSQSEYNLKKELKHLNEVQLQSHTQQLEEQKREDEQKMNLLIEQLATLTEHLKSVELDCVQRVRNAQLETISMRAQMESQMEMLQIKLHGVEEENMNMQNAMMILKNHNTRLSRQIQDEGVAKVRSESIMQRKFERCVQQLKVQLKLAKQELKANLQKEHMSQDETQSDTLLICMMLSVMFVMSLL